MQFVYFLHSMLSIIKRKFLTYEPDYIHISLKPMATTHLLGTNATTVTLNFYINLLTPNDPYMGHTAPLTSKRCILYIYSTNTGTEFFKHALYSTFFLFKIQFVS